MADGRFLSKSISYSNQIAGLSVLAELLFVRCLPHLDVEGRMDGEWRAIKALALPYRDEITVELLPDLMSELVKADLAIRYRGERGWVVQYPGFQRQQKGLRKNRERQSTWPDPPSDHNLIWTPEPSISSTLPDASGPTPASSGKNPDASGGIPQSGAVNDVTEFVRRPPDLLPHKGSKELPPLPPNGAELAGSGVEGRSGPRGARDPDPAADPEEPPDDPKAEIEERERAEDLRRRDLKAQIRTMQREDRP